MRKDQNSSYFSFISYSEILNWDIKQIESTFGNTEIGNKFYNRLKNCFNDLYSDLISILENYEDEDINRLINSYVISIVSSTNSRIPTIKISDLNERLFKIRIEFNYEEDTVFIHYDNFKLNKSDNLTYSMCYDIPSEIYKYLKFLIHLSIESVFKSSEYLIVTALSELEKEFGFEYLQISYKLQINKLDKFIIKILPIKDGLVLVSDCDKSFKIKDYFEENYRDINIIPSNIDDWKSFLSIEIARVSTK